MAHLYEILLRFNEEGFQGCHAIDIADNGREEPARPVAEEDIASLVGEQSAALIASLEAATARADAAEAQVAVLEQRAIAAETALAGKSRSLESAQHVIRTLKGE
jgi:hypothetical protein